MIPKIEIEKFLGSDNDTHSMQLCSQCGYVNRVKFKVKLFERRQVYDPDIRYCCIRCLNKLTYLFLNVKRSGK